MRKKIAMATLAILPLTVASANANGIVGVVTASTLNVRSGPSTSYSIISVAKKNEKVTILDSSNGWYKVKLGSGKEGWASGTYITKTNDTTSTTSNNTKKVSTNVNMRSGASTSYRVITVLKKGQSVEVISESNGWTKIKFDGRIGYVSSQYLEKSQSNTTTTNNNNNNAPTTTKSVNTDVLNVRSGPGTNHGIVGKAKRGEKLQVLLESNGWSKVNYAGKISYVSSSYLTAVNQPSQPKPEVKPDTPSDNNQNTGEANVNNNSLSYTLSDHVNRQFERISVGGNVIDSTKPRSSDVLTTFKMAQTRGFVNADKSDLEYFLNPENFRNSSKGMMQFLRLDRYRGGISVSELNSYLNSLVPASSGSNVFYNQGEAFINAAQKYNIDLVYLVSHAMWETGYGRSTLAQGQTLTSYKGQALDKPVKVYNFFGIGAIDGSANLSGAEASYSNGWTSIESTIDGSAKWIANGYIKSSKYNQNTVYKMKWNYDYTWHQYATDVNWANGISGIMNNLIKMYDTGSDLTFEIPKYK